MYSVWAKSWRSLQLQTAPGSVPALVFLTHSCSGYQHWCKRNWAWACLGRSGMEITVSRTWLWICLNGEPHVELEETVGGAGGEKIKKGDVCLFGGFLAGQKAWSPIYWTNEHVKGDAVISKHRHATWQISFLTMKNHQWQCVGWQIDCFINFLCIFQHILKSIQGFFLVFLPKPGVSKWLWFHPI